MEFTDIAMELSKEALAGFLSSPLCITVTRGKFRPCNFPLLLDSGCLLSEGLLRSLSPLG